MSRTAAAGLAYLITLAIGATGCSLTATWPTARGTASRSLGCAEDELETVFAHGYNLGAGDHVFRGCGRDVVVSCASGPTGATCRPTYVSPAD